MRIGIVGAGAIGGWIGISLAQAGHEVSALARGETLKALKAGPWRLTSVGQAVEAKVKASDDAAALGVQDIVVIAVKAPALPGLAEKVRPLIGAETIVIPAMNGVPWWFLLSGAGDLPATRLKTVDPTGAIEKAIPLSSVLGCVVHASATALEPGVIRHNNGRKLILGEPQGGKSPRLERVAAALTGAGFETVTSDRIQRDIWYKLWGNMTMNPISAITGVTCDRILDDPLVNAFILSIMAEAAAIGAGIGCEINERGEDRNRITRQLGAFKTSMLQDVEAGRPIELDALLSAPREIALALGRPTTNIDTLLGLTRLFGQSRKIYGA